jgi:Putative neutral zinc metallopeptidase
MRWRRLGRNPDLIDARGAGGGLGRGGLPGGRMAIPGGLGAAGLLVFLVSVRLELQADCYAGVWANTVYEAGDLEEGDIEETVGASEAVGDDRLQRRASGSIDPDSFTHDSSVQRARWFNTGRERGEPGDCDSFGAEDV